MPDEYMEYLYRRQAGVKAKPPKCEFKNELDTEEDPGYECEEKDDTSGIS